MHSRTKDEMDPRLRTLEEDVYKRIGNLQSHQLALLKEKEEVLLRQKRRQQDIHLKSDKQIVTHPCNNGHWISLAGFINDTHLNIDDIQLRKQQRQQQRQAMQENRRINEAKSNPPEVVAPVEQQKQGKKGGRTLRVDWKLMRELRQRDVIENKARLQRIEQNKRLKMNKYHQY